MSEFIEKLRGLPRFTSPKGMLFPANDGELVEVGSVIALFRSISEPSGNTGELEKEIELLKQSKADVEHNRGLISGELQLAVKALKRIIIALNDLDPNEIFEELDEAINDSKCTLEQIGKVSL